MIKIIEGANADEYKAELETAYRLRHDIFVDGMGWFDLRKPDGLERDQYDHEEAVHILLYDERGSLIGYQRMLPTTRPYLLIDLYPQLCDGTAPSSPSIWEWTRFAVVPEHRGDGRSLGLAGARLVQAFVEWGLGRGVEAVVVELAPIQMLKFAQCHFLTETLGIIGKIGGADTIAVLARFDRRTSARMVEVVASLQPQATPYSGFDEAA